MNIIINGETNGNGGVNCTMSIIGFEDGFRGYYSSRNHNTGFRVESVNNPDICKSDNALYIFGEDEEEDEDLFESTKEEMIWLSKQIPPSDIRIKVFLDGRNLSQRKVTKLMRYINS